MTHLQLEGKKKKCANMNVFRVIAEVETAPGPETKAEIVGGKWIVTRPELATPTMAADNA